MDLYQFYFSVKNDDFCGDGVYTVRFYNVVLQEYTYSSITINFNEILKVDGSALFKYVSFFRDRFGFLVYPFDLVVNFLKRVLSIDFVEPSFVIPDIYEPFTNTKIVSSVKFNFNDLLANDVFKNIHNIYLIVVDAIIVFGLLNLAKNKIMGVLEK